jgi:hypothetical protein
VAGGLIAGSGGLPGIVPASFDDDGGTHTSGDHPDGGGKHAGDGRYDGEQDWISAHHEVTAVPCDTDELIAALVRANAEGGGSLKLAPKCTYTLTGYDDHRSKPDVKPDDRSGLPVINHPISIKGEGATLVRDPTARLFRFFTVPGGGELHLSDLTLANGRAGSGGSIAVSHDGTAALARVTIRNSAAVARDGGGGAVFNDGHMTIVSSTFDHNRADGELGRGGAVLNGGVFTMRKSDLKNNSAHAFGGGFANYQGAADVSESTFVHNHAAEGGGVASVNARTKVWDSEVRDNTAKTGGGLVNRQAVLTMRNLAVLHNTAKGDGGGVANVEGVLTVDGGAVKANRAGGNGGGTFTTKGTLIVRHAEISKNSAGGHHSTGGGIFAQAGQVQLFAAQVTENIASRKPGGVFAAHARVTVDPATVISRNQPTNCGGSPVPIPNCFN